MKNLLTLPGKPETRTKFLNFKNKNSKFKKGTRQKSQNPISRILQRIEDPNMKDLNSQ